MFNKMKQFYKTLYTYTIIVLNTFLYISSDSITNGVYNYISQGNVDLYVCLFIIFVRVRDGDSREKKNPQIPFVHNLASFLSR